jgi:hypothetical protein
MSEIFGDKIVVLLSLNIDESIGKKLFGSLFSSGSVPIICTIAGLAVLAAIVIYLQKKKKGNKGDNDDE